MAIDAYASLPHYRAHIEPIWRALPIDLRGDFRGPWGDLATSRWSRDRTVLVASGLDAVRVAPRPFIYVEHGAGQSYSGDPRAEHVKGHAGAAGLDRCSLFLSPNESVAKRWRFAYPDVSTVVVGCPRLDRYYHHGDGGQVDPDRVEGPLLRPPDTQPTVAITFHWDCGLLPETRSAWNHFGRALRWLPRDRWRLLGHGHPREASILERRWGSIGIESTRSIDTVLAEADVLVADNTSAMWEFAAVGKPLVILDAPEYRRDVHHGLRFWTHADAGVRIDNPDDLADAIDTALADPAPYPANRAAAAADIYSALDGRASERAAAAIAAVMEER